jgi:4,5-dihydroxyphthalate decarboxylase
LHPSELFWRQLHSVEFDVFEMSLSTCFRLASLDDDRWVVLPIFTNRSLCHLSILVRDESGILAPADLRGKRIAVPEYQQTSAVWSRGEIDRDFGVPPEQIAWFMERGDDRSHGAETAFAAPPGIRITRIEPGASIGTMLVSGQLDGTLLYLGEQNLVDRSPRLSDGELGVHPLFDPAAERERRRGRPLHASHCVAIRRTVAERHPELVASVREAFDEAKTLARGEEADDPTPYGYPANAEMLEELAHFVHDQGIAVRYVEPRALFAAEPAGTTRKGSDR